MVRPGCASSASSRRHSEASKLRAGVSHYELLLLYWEGVMRSVVLLGKGKLAVRIAEWFRTSKAYELRYVVPVVPEPTWTDSLIAWCQSHEVPFAASGHYRDLPDVRRGEWKTDLAFSVFYDRIIQPWFIQKVSRIINLHNGPLPRYRGVSPI